MKLRGNKFGAKKVTLDGYLFDSIAESRRYQELKLLQRAGEIESLEVHPRYALMSPSTTGTIRGALGPQARLIGHYEADFSYYDTERRIEDVKGFDTPLSKWKRKHVRAQYGIDVQIVKADRRR